MFGIFKKKEAELKDKRQHERIKGKWNDFIQIDSRQYVLHNWSPGGFRVMQYDDDQYVKRQKIRAKLSISGSEYRTNDLSLDLECVILRANKGDLAGAWIFVNPENKKMLNEYHEKKLLIIAEEMKKK
jgi:hypothetical protein